MGAFIPRNAYINKEYLNNLTSKPKELEKAKVNPKLLEKRKYIDRKY